MTVTELVTCPVCGDPCHASATTCECGARLTPSNTTAGPRAHLGDGSEAQQKEASVMAPHDADCTCNRCYLDQLEGDPLVESFDRAFRLLTQPNVVDLHSKRVS